MSLSLVTGARRLSPTLTGYALSQFCSALDVNQPKEEVTHRAGATCGKTSSASVSDTGFVMVIFERDLDLNMTGSNLELTR
jgi:hypothetical protein